MGKQPQAGKKTKDAIMKAASSSSKQGKKKWTKGRVKDKANNAVYFDETLYKRVLADTPKMKLITIPILVDKFKLNGSLARVLLKHLEEKAMIKAVGK
jgi:small subunit ribosomal protein S25e